MSLTSVGIDVVVREEDERAGDVARSSGSEGGGEKQGADRFAMVPVCRVALDRKAYEASEGGVLKCQHSRWMQN